MTKHTSRPAWRRSSRKRLNDERVELLAPAIEQRDERALGDARRDRSSSRTSIISTRAWRARSLR